MKRVKCKGCEVEFRALRSDAVTCSPKCRQRYKRMCDKITEQMAIDFKRCQACDMPTPRTGNDTCRECRGRIANAN